MDKIIVRDLNVRNIIGVDAWERSKRQPLNINIQIHTNVDASGEHDLLSESINYGTVAKTVQEFSERTAYRSVEALASGIARVCVRDCKAERVTVQVEKPRALLHAACAGVEITRSREDIDRLDEMRTAASSAHVPLPPAGEDVVGEDKIFVKDLTLNTIIGVNPWEREEKQRVVVSLTIHLRFQPTLLIEDHVPKMHNYRTITRTISRYVEQSRYKTVEALALSIAKVMVESCHVPKVTVRVEKPSALVFAAGAGIEITRDRASFGLETPADGSLVTLHERPASTNTLVVHPSSPESEITPTASADSVSSPVTGANNNHSHTVFIALGANLGDRARNIEDALTKLDASGAIQIAETSFLYETAPMYVADQPVFLNAVCKVKTNLAPEPLLDLLKRVEAEIGRDFGGERYGPRPIDLDILYYDHLELRTGRLTIPHPRIKEREFVLRPLCDLAPDMEHPGLFRTCAQLLALLKHAERSQSEVVQRVMPIRDGLWRWGSRTLLMGILNVTPDSFSDGGAHPTVDAAVDRAVEMVAQGADVIDVGGMSTRPNADEIPEEEELQRVVPVIQAIRRKGVRVPISVDTYRSRVAAAALESGADLVNDVTGGAHDPKIFEVAAKAKAPLCLMHMRGNPKTMMRLTDYQGDVIGDIRLTLESAVTAAMEAGVRRWNIIVDPGIGFAKTVEQNFEILRGLPEIVKSGTALAGFPTLVGPSRKGFIGQAIQEKDPKNRIWGTAAACSASVSGGADLLRVHDVKEMRDVVLVADKCFKTKPR
ncbi:trifunctional dihydropteroate synthetase [Borealophlyctis nickersoniae]|nr:trifunctional dihydropteroate synthetase [Borealophlyctis nickersoniae]